MIELLLEAEDGTVKESVPVENAEETQSFSEMRHGEVELYREDWDAINEQLDRRNDVLRVTHGSETLIAGRFDADERGGGLVTIAIVGFERDAKDAEPTSGNVIYQNTPDSDIVTNLISDVPTLEVGTIETVANNLSVSFSHANISKALRDVSEATGAEIRYNNDRTVDYLDRRGSDKTATVTLSPDSQNVVEELRIVEDAREEVTHVRGYGAQSGPDQIVTEAVADSYEPGERQIWREYENKDIQEESRLQRIVSRMAEEYDGQPRHLEVETSTVEESLKLGDSITITIPAENVNRELRIMERRNILGSMGALLGLSLSNRMVTRTNAEGEGRKDLQRFNRGYEGYVDRNTDRSGWNPAGDGTPQTYVEPNWPDDIVEEKTVELTVQGRAWRSPTDPQSHDHSVSFPDHAHDVSFDTTSADNSDYENIVSEYAQMANGVASSGATENITGVFPGAGTQHFNTTRDHSEIRASATINVVIPDLPTSTEPEFIRYWLEDGNGNRYGQRRFDAGVFSGEQEYWFTFAATIARNASDEKIRIFFENDTVEDISYRSWTSFQAVGQHNHDIGTSTTSDSGGGTTQTTNEVSASEPKVVTSFDGESYYPTGVDIRVNGSTVDTLTGTNQDWSQTIDLAGQLTPGQNTIEAEPTGERGELNLILATELFRRGETDE